MSNVQKKLEVATTKLIERLEIELDLFSLFQIMFKHVQTWCQTIEASIWQLRHRKHDFFVK